jgi:hypothetical protein
MKTKKQWKYFKFQYYYCRNDEFREVKKKSDAQDLKLNAQMILKIIKVSKCMHQCFFGILNSFLKKINIFWLTPMLLYFRQASLKAEHIGALLTAVQSVLDLGHAVHWLPDGVLWGGSVSPWQRGLLGTLSSLIGLYRALRL